MARARMLAGSISVSEQVAELSTDFARLLFTWMIAHADDYGVLTGSPARVKAIVVPMLDCGTQQVEAALDDLEAHDLIWRYASADGTRYVQFRTWEEHQQGLHKRTAPKFPHAPVCPCPCCSEHFPEVPGSSRPRARARNGTEQNRTEGKEKGRGTGEPDGALPRAALSLENAQAPEPEPELSTPDPDRALLADLDEACRTTLGGVGKDRARRYRDGVRRLAVRGVQPAHVPKLYRQYRAKFGDTIPCMPWNLDEHYDELTGATNGTTRKPARDVEGENRRFRDALAANGIVGLPTRGVPPGTAGGSGASAPDLARVDHSA